jgi:uncharacterized protein with PQ loop repeat
MITKILIENTLIILAEAFWLSSAYSQLRKLARTRNPKGLFAPTLALNAAGNIGWMTYFASRHLWVPLVTNFGSFVLTVCILGYLLVDRKQFLKAFTSVLCVGFFAAVALITLSNYAGWVAVVFNMLAATPWLFHIVTTKRTSGLSERGLYFALGALACTLVYGIMIGSVPLIAGCLQGFTYTIIIALYYYRYRHSN